MNIIVEGNDGVGKDTFIQKLAILTNKKVVRGSSFEMSSAGTDKMFEELKAMVYRNNDLIINRFFYSNLVYGSLFGYPTLSKEQCKILQEMVDDTCTVYYLSASTQTLEKRVGKRGDDKIDIKDLGEISLAYDQMWKENTPKSFLQIDTEDDKLLDINADIYKKIIENDKEKDFIKYELRSRI